MAKSNWHINWKVEFGWRFWLPFVFVAFSIVLAEDRHPIVAFIASIGAVMTAEESGKYIAHKQAEQKDPR